ncbi:MAG TPA: hypothetical protein VL754_07600 [Verrucomicrobiae bacterium]|nr:hypothetical protein [Verrucomicrobiae bacterium]
MLLILLQAALIIPGIAEAGEDLTLQAITNVLRTLVPILQLLLPIVIIPILIHEEPLVGTTAFWFTRPLDGGTLLKSKMLFLGSILILPPLVTELVILATHGASARQLWLAAPEIFLEQLKFLAYIMVLAALTQSFARFALLGASFFIGYYLLILVYMTVVWYTGTPSFLKGPSKPHLEDSRYVVTTLATLAISAYLLIGLYRAREARRAWLSIGLAVVFVSLLNHFWSWDFLGRSNEEQRAAIDTAAVNVAVVPDPRARRVSDELRRRPQDNAKKNISAPLQISGLPAGYAVEPRNIQASLTFPDGRTLEHKGYVSNFDPSAKLNARVIQEILGPIKILNAEKTRSNMATLFSVSDEDFSKFATIPGKLSAVIDFVVKRYELTGKIPVRAKARYDHGSERAVITQVLKQTGGSNILLRESKISLFFDAGRSSYGAFADFVMRPITYILLNDKRNEALWPDERPGPGFEFFDVLFQKRLITFPLALHYTALTEQGGKLTEFNDAWLAQGALARIETKEVGHFTKDIQVDDFIMGAQ